MEQQKNNNFDEVETKFSKSWNNLNEEPNKEKIEHIDLNVLLHKQKNVEASVNLEDEFAETWNQENTNEIQINEKKLEKESEKKLENDPEKISNINPIKIEQLKQQGIDMLNDFKHKGIEVNGINETMIIKEWDDIYYLNCNNNKSYIKSVISSILDYGFETPRPIQCATIGRIAKGGDMITQAKAGNGKTAAFVIGSVLRIDPTLHSTQLLILSPTQLLTDQTMEVVKNLTKNTGLIVHCYRGGLYQPRNGMIPQIVVGCPGRINDMIKHKRINLNNLQTLILDEGDELLKQGFREQIKTIIEHLAFNVQICIFSATLPKGILELSTKFMRDPAYVILPENQVITELVTQWYVRCTNLSDKDGCVIDAIETNPKDIIIVFFNSCTRLQKFSQILKSYKNPIQHLCIHSRMEPSERDKSIYDFINGKSKILLASDIAARGLDFTCVTLVINYDIPCDIETYVHRIGRSGRGDRLGNSITLVMTEEDYKRMMFIVDIHGIPIKVLKTIKMESKPSLHPLSSTVHQPIKEK